MSHRYIVRMFNIPENLTKKDLEDKLINERINFRNIYFASHNGNLSAGFAFIEFDRIEDMEDLRNVFKNVQEDVLYS